MSTLLTEAEKYAIHLEMNEEPQAAEIVRRLMDEIKTKDSSSSNQRLEFLRQALSLAREAMIDCQHNAHKGKVCFDGDHWHETLETVDAALKRIADETSRCPAGLKGYTRCKLSMGHSGDCDYEDLL